MVIEIYAHIIITDEEPEPEPEPEHRHGFMVVNSLDDVPEPLRTILKKTMGKK